MLFALRASLHDTWRSLTSSDTMHSLPLGCAASVGLAATSSALSTHHRNKQHACCSGSRHSPSQQASFLPNRSAIASRAAVKYADGPSAPITGFQQTHQLPDGSTIVIKPLTTDELDETADLLVETYFRTYNLSPYKRYLMGQVRKYLREHMQLPPDAVVLVAVMDEPAASSSSMAELRRRTAATPSGHPEPADASSSAGSRRVRYPVPGRTADNDASAGAGSTSASTSAASNGSRLGPRVVGAAEVSFSQGARSRYPSLNPPPEGAFLTNMAVDERVRRRGIGTKLLQAAVDVTALSNRRELFLHVRLQDEPARRLYAKHGFRLVEQDWVVVWLFGRDRKQLLCKFLDEE